MIEKNRQIVIFGNFNGINFDSLVLFSEIKDKYKLQISAMPDIPVEAVKGGTPVIVNAVNNLNIRPALQSEDKKTTVFFGASRIHIEQLDQTMDSYEQFYGMALEIISDILQKIKVVVNRIAINGQIVNYQQEIMDAAYKKIFKKSTLYGDTSDEWQFRITTRENNDKPSCVINKVISYTRGFVFEPTGQAKAVLATVYDFNTKQDLSREFELDEIKEFYTLGCEYRNNLLK